MLADGGMPVYEIVLMGMNKNANPAAWYARQSIAVRKSIPRFRLVMRKRASPTITQPVPIRRRASTGNQKAYDIGVVFLALGEEVHFGHDAPF